MSLYVYTCYSVWLYVSKCIYLLQCLAICLYMYIPATVFGYMSLYVYTCYSVWLYVSICIYLLQCSAACLYMHIPATVFCCMSLPNSLGSTDANRTPMTVLSSPHITPNTFSSSKRMDTRGSCTRYTHTYTYTCTDTSMMCVMCSNYASVRVGVDYDKITPYCNQIWVFPIMIMNGL